MMGMNGRGGMEPGGSRVEQQNLNSRHKEEGDFGGMIIWEQNGVANLLRELRNGIGAEVEGTTRRHLCTFSESNEPMKNWEMRIDGTHETQSIDTVMIVFHLSRSSGPCKLRLSQVSPVYHSRHWS